MSAIQLTNCSCIFSFTCVTVVFCVCVKERFLQVLCYFLCIGWVNIQIINNYEIQVPIHVMRLLYLLLLGPEDDHIHMVGTSDQIWNKYWFGKWLNWRFIPINNNEILLALYISLKPIYEVHIQKYLRMIANVCEKNSTELSKYSQMLANFIRLYFFINI